MMMAADTPVMLMDEVMNGLDVDNVALISDCLMEMKKDKLIFVASHLLSNLDLYADRVLFLKDGKFVHEHKFTGENDVFLKIEVTPEQYESLNEKVALPLGHIYIAKHLLCIPLKGMSESEQTQWIERMLDYNEKEMTVGPMGTVEYYDKFYSKNV